MSTWDRFHAPGSSREFLREFEDQFVCCRKIGERRPYFGGMIRREVGHVPVERAEDITHSRCDRSGSVLQVGVHPVKEKECPPAARRAAWLSFDWHHQRGRRSARSLASQPPGRSFDAAILWNLASSSAAEGSRRSSPRSSEERYDEETERVIDEQTPVTCHCLVDFLNCSGVPRCR